ncbi:death domain-containing protein 1 [Tiliqua scincoides]|uniref:death domain-containing protein 1 n=1 Tax=Tiliqua scincoides TaxID=71010 RepID=UPI0034620074
METTGVVVEKPDQILEQIWHGNLTLREALHKSDCQVHEKIAEYIQKLTRQLLELVKALSGQLDHTIEVLQNTSQLLNALQDKEGNRLADWLLELCKHIVHAVGYLGVAETKLPETTSKITDKVQYDPCTCGKSEHDTDKETLNDVQVAACVNQPLHELSTVLEEENRTQVIENQTEEIETIVYLKEILSGQSQESLTVMEIKDLIMQEKPPRVPRTNTADCHVVKPSTKKIPINIGLEDIPGNNEKEVTVANKLENNGVEQAGKLPDQEVLAEITEIPKEAENSEHQLIVKPGNMAEDINQIEISNENIQGDQESVLSSSDSGNAHTDKSINLPTSELEEEDREDEWVNKEFLVEENAMSDSDSELACCITAPFHVLEHLVIRTVNYLSSLVVNDSEELVSNVISIESSQDSQILVSPIIVVIPFTARYRGMYKDIMVKVTDMNFQSIYLTPVSLEGYQGNQKGTFAEVKTCQLGLFSVVSCLKLEMFTIPRKGLSRKLSMDSRISFCYPPSTFTSRVSMQLKVQPVEPSTVSMLKTKHDVYHSVASTSPLLHLQHSSSQPFNKPITIILPCPPNPEKIRQGDEMDHGRAASASVHRVATVHRFRVMSASPRKHGENLNESLKLLGYRSKEEGWALLDDITVRNAQRGLVSFELDETLESFIVIRLSSAMDSAHLVLFIQQLEEATYNTMAKVALYRKKEDPYKIVVLLVPSKELNLELQSLREEGYSGPPDSSQQFRLREGEQIHFRFSGNIFASDDGTSFGKTYKLTFHAQRKSRLALQIKEVDEFGNYSSPHYKGTILFYKLSKEAIAKDLEQPLLPDDYQQQTPLCKLVLTLPKKEKLINRPQSTKRRSTDAAEAQWDSLMYWVSQELSEDNAVRLALSLPLHRSTLQLIKLKCPDNLTEQIYELLCFWKRNLPRSTDKLQLLSRYLCKSGRSDLAEDLHFKWENKVSVWKAH